jgi:hypothetical protein
VFQKEIIQWDQKILESSLQSQEFEVMAGEKIGLSKINTNILSNQ